MVITRRSFLAGSATAISAHGENVHVPRPTPAQLAWQDFELGLLVCLDLPVFAQGGWRETRETLDPNIYSPAKLDTDQWLEAAKSMGCRYAIFTATHFNGFLQWQSDVYPYGLKQTRWRGGKADVFGDFVKSCHKYRIQPGVFLSRHRNAYLKAWGHRVNWGAGGPGQAEFARTGEKMTEELVSRYGPLCEIWYDAGMLHPRDGGPDVLPIVNRFQPKTVFYHSPQRRDHRWIGNESGLAGYPNWATMPDLEASDRAHHGRESLKVLLPHGDPNGPRWEPGMVDVPIRDHEWFWRPNQDSKVFSTDRLVNMYYTSVGRNANFILGAVVNPDGLIPRADMDRYAELGNEIRRRFEKPLAQTRGSGGKIELVIQPPARIDHLGVMEDIAQGERVRGYLVERLAGADDWRKICEGASIGHKRIQKFEPVEVSRIRLRVTESVAKPQFRQFAVYRTDHA